MDEKFSGSKVALLIGEKLLITLRDDFDHIPCPNMWDMPGGGADPGETPWQTLVREVQEEVGLDMTRADVLWQRRYEAVHSDGWVMFYVARMAASAEQEIVFGDEGQGWQLVSIPAYFALDRVVPSLASRLRDWLDEQSGGDRAGIPENAR